MSTYVNPFELIDRRLSAIEHVLQEIRQQKSEPAPSTEPSPIISSEHVKAMTGWPDGTFYQKVHQMPEGVVIRGKSKRLLFDRAKLIAWLTGGDSAEALPFGPVKKIKHGVA